MVAFATLLLGLTLGVQPVTVIAAGPVTSVELLLDGEPVGTATAEGSWTVPVDFGAELAPHELVAVARDGDGRELERVRQPVNLPRSPAEAELVIEGAERGEGAVARVTWQSVAAPEPREVTATFDGRPLGVSDPRRVELPPFDPRQLHFLRVELDFGETVSTVVEAIFGGVYRNRTQTELTAVPVVVEEEGALPEEAGELAGWFASPDGEPLRAVAVEEGAAEVLMILDRAAQAELWDLARTWLPDAASVRRGGVVSGRRRASDPRPGAGGRPDTSPLRFDMRLGEDQTLRFFWPAPRRLERDGSVIELFPRSEEHPPAHGGVFWLAAEAHQPPFSRSEQRLADAVAVAGMNVIGRARRRAVVLLLGEDPVDASRFGAPRVRRYLERIGVPLSVWSLGEPDEALRRAWGEVRTVDARHRFTGAVEALVEELAAQRIVWIEGRHLPDRVVLTERARGIRRLR
ncbi:MAG: hypothetical protein PVG07_03040 [Acidobacteriota bacterium]|jgi:hypothetical protein